MSAILWQESWTLGIDPVDAEHRRLVDSVNQLAARFTLDPAQAPEPSGGRAGTTPATPRPTTQPSLRPSKPLPSRPGSISSTKKT
jgi:hypothetical protein